MKKTRSRRWPLYRRFYHQNEAIDQSIRAQAATIFIAIWSHFRNSKTINQSITRSLPSRSSRLPSFFAHCVCPAVFVSLDRCLCAKAADWIFAFCALFSVGLLVGRATICLEAPCKRLLAAWAMDFLVWLFRRHLLGLAFAVNQRQPETLYTVNLMVTPHLLSHTP